jgi:hypothetical protein
MRKTSMSMSWIVLAVVPQWGKKRKPIIAMNKESASIKGQTLDPGR